MYAVREAGSLQHEHENLKKHARNAWLLGFLADAARSYFGSESTKVSFLADAARSFLAVSQLRSAMGKTIQVLHQSPGFPNFSQVVIHVQLGIVFAFSLGLKFEAK